MAAPYSEDLRLKVLAAYARQQTTKEIADAFGVSKAWARRVKQVKREQGRTAALPMGGATVVKIDAATLLTLVRETPDATLKELRDRLDAECTPAAVWAALRRLTISSKKRSFTRASRTAPTLRAAARSGSWRGRGSTRPG